MYVTYAGCPAWLGGGERVLLARKTNGVEGLRARRGLAAKCETARGSRHGAAAQSRRRRASERAAAREEACGAGPGAGTGSGDGAAAEAAAGAGAARETLAGRRRRRPGAMAEARRQVLRWWSGGWSDGGGLLLWAGARARLLALAPRKAYLDASAN